MGIRKTVEWTQGCVVISVAIQSGLKKSVFDIVLDGLCDSGWQIGFRLVIQVDLRFLYCISEVG